MGNNYRVRLKKGEQEIEIESTDKNYVDSKLNELLPKFPQLTDKSTTSKSRKKTTVKPEVEKDSTVDSKFNADALVECIHEFENYLDVEQNIIEKKGMLQKIMMCMYFAKDLFDPPYLTTGQVEATTDQMGIKIGMANAGAKIRKNLKYFSKGKKKGRTVLYKLNLPGEKAFEKFMKGEKP